jgi:hypothetical protein
MTWEPIAIVASLWLAAGMTCASTLYRRGHDGGHWMFICGLAGPLAFLVVADQARTVERETRPRTIARTGTPRDGITVLVPAAAVGAVDAHALEHLGLTVGRVAVATTVTYEHSVGIAWDAAQDSTRATHAEASLRFAPHPVELVVLPGNLADTLARWAGENAPAALVTTRRAHRPRTLGRLTRLAAEHPGVSVLVLDPASLAAGTVRAA